VKITGVRHAESPRRRHSWKLFQRWDATRSHGKASESSWIVNPIIYWSNDDVWAFIHNRHLPYCELYDEGFKRLGCIGCPMSGAKGVQRDFARWPQYERAWRRAFHRLWQRRHGQVMTRGKRRGQLWPGLPGIETPDELFEWWKSGKPAPKEEEETCQLGLW
jgi:phosphoadenosine phosphosulfate reductase